MNNKVLIILGMHRSGTSLTAQWLYKSGLNIGDNLMPPHFSNKDGHFEDMDFHDLHEEIFDAHKIPYGGFENIENFSLSLKDIKKIKDLINIKNNRNIQWGWKEPRTCLFINKYIDLIPDATILLVIRDYNKILNSLITREITPKINNIKQKGRFGIIHYLKYKLLREKKENTKIGKKYSLALIQYYKEILRIIPKVKELIVIDFDKILTQEEKVLDLLKDSGFNLNCQINIGEILKPQLLNSKKKCNYVFKEKEIKKLHNQLKSLSKG